MVDIWNPLDNIKKPVPQCDYYLIDRCGEVIQIVKNDFGKAVKAAKKLIDTEQIEVQIVPKEGK